MKYNEATDIKQQVLFMAIKIYFKKQKLTSNSALMITFSFPFPLTGTTSVSFWEKKIIKIPFNTVI